MSRETKINQREQRLTMPRAAGIAGIIAGGLFISDDVDAQASNAALACGLDGLAGAGADVQHRLVPVADAHFSSVDAERQYPDPDQQLSPRPTKRNGGFHTVFGISVPSKGLGALIGG